MNKEYLNAIKLAGYVFFYLPIERCERRRYIDESDRYYFNDGLICGICGEIVDRLGGRSGVKDHLVEKHSEWIDTYIIDVKYSKIDFQKLKNKKLSYSSKTRLDRNKKRVYMKPWKNPDSLFCDTKFLEEFFGKKIAKGDECKDNEK